MAVEIIRKREFEGTYRYGEAAKSPQEAVAKTELRETIHQLTSVIGGWSLEIFAKDLIDLDQGARDVDPVGGRVAVIEAMTRSRDANPVWRLEYVRGSNESPDGDRAGVLFEYDIEKKAPLRLQIADTMGRYALNASFVEGGVTSMELMQRSVKYGDHPNAVRNLKLTKDKTSITLVIDTFEVRKTQ